MNRTCKKYHKKLVSYLDRELQEKEFAYITEHLRDCTICQGKLDELQESMSILLEWKEIEPSEGYDYVFWEKVAKLKEDRETKKEKRGIPHFLQLCFNQRFSLVTSAALAVFIVVITFFALKPQRDLPSNELGFTKDIELFYNMEIIEHSEALENFEVINLLDVLEQEVKG